MDDILLACRANERNATVIKQVLHQFSVWSRQEANKQKSRIFFSANVEWITKRVVRNILGFLEFKIGAIYLGNSLVFCRKRSKEFDKLKKRRQCRLEGWQSQILSRVGKATFICSVAQAIPFYSMSTFRVPAVMCQALDSLVQKFW